MIAIEPVVVELRHWIFDGPAPSPDEPTLSLLTADERDRARRYRFDRDRDRFVRRRAGLRRVLAGRLGIAPADVELVEGRGLKPRIAGVVPGEPIDFNVSHSGEHAVIALAAGRRIGVDVERVRPLPDFDVVAPTVFTPREIAWWRSHPDTARAAAFFRLWTRKEAVLKAEGFGLSVAPATVDVPMARLEPGTIVAADGTEPGPGWWIGEASPAPGVAVAVAVERLAADDPAPGPGQSPRHPAMMFRWMSDVPA